jgi:iron complex outermembrane receptor protein
LSLFANYIDNYIFAHKVAGKFVDNVPVYQFVQGNARLLGGEASIDIHPVERLHFQNAFSYVDAVQLNQTAEARHLPMTPAPRWTSELKYDIIRDGETLNNTYIKMGLECNLRQNHFYGLDNTETATPSYTLLNASMGTDIKCRGKKILSVYLTGDNLTNRAYQNHLSRLKYAGINPVTGRQGVFNMGRNFGIKVVAPINL